MEDMVGRVFPELGWGRVSLRVNSYTVTIVRLSLFWFYLSALA